MLMNVLTFELRIFLRKKRSRIEQLKKGVKRRLFFCVPAQEAKSGQPLAPILGQVQINAFEFATLINNKAKEYPAGMLLFIELNVKWDKTYEIFIKPFPLSYFIYEYLFLPIQELSLKNQPRWCIGLCDLYKIALINQYIYGVYDLKNSLKSTYNMLVSFNTKLKLFSESEYIYYITSFFQRRNTIVLLIEQNVKGYGLLNYRLQENRLLLSQKFMMENDVEDGME